MHLFVGLAQRFHFYFSFNSPGLQGDTDPVLPMVIALNLYTMNICNVSAI